MEDNSFELTLVESLASFSCFKFVTDYYVTLPLGNCDFEDQFCKWMNMKEDTFDWTSQTGKTPSSQTGPSRDHTSGIVNYKITFLFMTKMSNNSISLLSFPVIFTVTINSSPSSLPPDTIITSSLQYQTRS